MMAVWNVVSRGVFLVLVVMLMQVSEESLLTSITLSPRRITTTDLKNPTALTATPKRRTITTVASKVENNIKFTITSEFVHSTIIETTPYKEPMQVTMATMRQIEPKTNVLKSIENKDNQSLSEGQRSIMIGFLLVLALVGVFGNALIICVYASLRKMILKMDHMLLILAIMSLFASLYKPALNIYWISKAYKYWKFGDIGCKFLPAIERVLISVVHGVILILALDHDKALVSPLSAQYSISALYKAVVVSMVASFVTAAPYIYYQTLNAENVCTVNYFYSQEYANYTLTIFLGSDLLFLAIFTTTMVRMTVKLARRQVFDISSIQIKENQRAVKITFAVGVTFFVLIFPKDLFLVMQAFSSLQQQSLQKTNHTLVSLVLELLHTASYCINVFLYLWLYVRFRNEAKRLCCQKWRIFVRDTIDSKPHTSSMPVSTVEPKITDKVLKLKADEKFPTAIFREKPKKELHYNHTFKNNATLTDIDEESEDVFL